MRARCLSSACRALFPEVLSGFYTDLEMHDTFPNEELNIELNDDGEVIINNKEN